MDALATGHDAAVQMIDTSVVRVHQRGAGGADNDQQNMGRSRGGPDKQDSRGPSAPVIRFFIHNVFRDLA
jgi:hypothetical protein